MAASTREIKSPCDKKVKILKWKVRKNSMVYKGSILALYSTVPDEGEGITAKLKATETGTVAEVVAEEGEIIPSFGTMLLLRPQADGVCTHSTIMKDMCADCGADLRQELGSAGDRKKSVSASVAMVHSIPELIVSQEQALELGKEDENRLLRERKLVLLVDLDQTLIHTTNDNIPPNLKDVKHFQLFHGKSCMWYHTKFRPYTEQFLQAVSKMYELHICTFGVRMYAHVIARLLDPNEKYFSHRILSRDECFDNLSKTANLKALFPCGDIMVGIIDDREDVWNFAPNLVHVKPYRFFQGTADINAPPGLTKSENDDIPVKHKCVNQKPNTAPDSGNEKEKYENKKDMADESGQMADGSEVHEESKDTASISKMETCEMDIESSELLSGNEEKLSSAESKPGDVDDKLQAVDSDKKDLLSEMDITLNVVNDDTSDNGLDKKTVDEHIDVTSQEEKINQTLEGDNDAEKQDEGDKLMEAESEKGKSETDDMKNDSDEIEWEDSDDYLLHLEEILRRIHTAYYEMYEQSQNSSSNQLPDLKNIIPYVRKKVLKGANIVFSGMFPLNMQMEKSRAYITAKSLGANVQNDIVPNKSKQDKHPEATTHLVAAKAGTGKYKSALKTKGINIVSGDWLWACAERWEWVDERLYYFIPKKNEVGKEENGGAGDSPSGKENQTGKRKKPLASGDDKDESRIEFLEEETLQPPKKCLKSTDSDQNLSATDQVASSTNSDALDDQQLSEKFSSSYNPLYSFSNEDIEFMDKEVDEMMAEEGGDSSDDSEEERDSRLRKEVLGQSSTSDSDSDSLAGDFPRGWKLRRKSFSPPHSEHSEERVRETDEEVLDEDTENELEQYQKTVEAFSPRDSESESNSEGDSIGSVDDEIAEAVEKEFLGAL